MGTVKWDGSESTNSSDPANWSTGAIPVGGDDVVFDATSDSGNHCVLNFTTSAPTFPEDGNDLNSITIGSDFTKQIQTGAACEVNLEGIITINKPACIKNGHALTFDFNAAPSTTVYDGNGTSYSYKPFVVFSSGMTSSVFENTDARANTTFNFGSQNFSMVDGVYPNVTFTGILYAKRIYSDNAKTEFNTYGSVDILNFNGGQVKSSSFNIYDYEKEYYFEKDLTSLGEYFQFGHTTARFKTYRSSGTGSVTFPVTGELKSAAFGNDTTNNFYTQYHKVIIENNDSSSNYWLVSAGLTLECNELVISDGGRFYGPSSGTKAVAIRSVKRPTVQGDWNFRQTADGIYESIGDSSNTPVFHGGTGRQTLTKNTVLCGDGMNRVVLVNDLNLSLPFIYQRDSLGNNAYDLRSVAAAASSSSLNAYPMAAAGKVIAFSISSGGTSISADANNQTFEVRTNGGSGTNILFSRNDMTNTNGTNYTYTTTGLSISFAANDQLQVRRTAGSLVFGNVNVILYVRYD
ncbi:MAG: hypothetical protein CMF55_00420 [Legionellales bacterium]|nr:hypothetical protein [Legionellales bacterium]|tara:strand:+ start:304 stop:1860 length:1557 start_codon:yes stop_codon:yes gene_type:complete